MEDFPRVTQTTKSFFVEFGPHASTATGRPLGMVLDFDRHNALVGIEILNLTFEAGGKSLDIISRSVRTDGDGLRYSYDADSDSFYLRFKTERSADQKAVQGLMLCDGDGQIVALRADWH